MMKYNEILGICLHNSLCVSLSLSLLPKFQHYLRNTKTPCSFLTAPSPFLPEIPLIFSLGVHFNLFLGIGLVIQILHMMKSVEIVLSYFT